ncbi:MAG: hypothetical protein R2792_18010 [Saprospiraceae bacterium]
MIPAVRLPTTPHCIGWLMEDDEGLGPRPIDLEHLPDGSLLVSDSFANAIYRISYSGK